MLGKKRFSVLMIMFLLVSMTSIALAGGTLIIAKNQEAVGFDPHKVPASSSIGIYQHIYNGLINIREEGGFEPILAESWTIEDDTTYIFKLRQGVKFHNGREMTSEDVKYSFERILDPATASIAASYFTAIDEILTPDPYTVVFKLKEVVADFLINLSNVWAAVVPKEVVEEHGDLMQVAVGTGPFTMNAWVPDNYTSLTKFPDYFEPGLPKVDELRFIILKDEAARVAALRTGTAHISSITSEAAQMLEGQKNLNIVAYPSLRYDYWAFNVSKPPFNDPRVRLAMSYAIDRQEIIDIVYAGQATLTGPVPTSQAGWGLEPLDSYPSYTRDLEKAKALLAEAGYEDGLKFKIKTASTYPHYVDMAVTIQHHLQQIGVSTEIELVEWGTYIEAWTNNYHDSLVGNNGAGVTPDRSLNFFFHTDGTANVWGFSDPEFDVLVAEGKRTVDQDRRYQIYAQAQRMLVNELAPNLFLSSPKDFYAISDKVTGFTPTAITGERAFKNASFK